MFDWLIDWLVFDLGKGCVVVNNFAEFLKGEQETMNDKKHFFSENNVQCKL